MLVLSIFACTPTYITNTYVYELPSEDEYVRDTGIEQVGGEEDSGGSFADPDALTSELFTAEGLSFWFEVSDEQRTTMNENWQNSWYYGYGYAYQVETETNDATYADSMVVEDPSLAVRADFGKIEFDLTGQSTGMVWDPEEPTSIPAFRIDVGEFQDNLLIGAEDRRWLAFHNGMITRVMSEPIAYKVMAAMGETVPRTNFVWVGSSVWGEDIRIPYVLVEKYKIDWCTEHSETLGGCQAMWESFGDFNDWYYSYLITSQTCEFDECDTTNVSALKEQIAQLGYTDGFEEGTKAYVNWDAVRRQQVLNWLLWIGDDPFHNTNNVVWLEGDDGRGRYLPYSVDLSAGAAGWYTDTTFYGWNTLASGCQSDAHCIEELFAAGHQAIADFRLTRPADIVDEVCQSLNDMGMMRDGDDMECTRLHDWYESRADEATAELRLVENQYSSGCSDTGMVLWGGGNDTGSSSAPCDTGF